VAALSRSRLASLLQSDTNFVVARRSGESRNDGKFPYGPASAEMAVRSTQPTQLTFAHAAMNDTPRIRARTARIRKPRSNAEKIARADRAQA